MRLQSSSSTTSSNKRSRKPSAFAPAVGVKNGGATSLPSGTMESRSSRPPLSTLPSVKPDSSVAIRSAIVHFLSGGLAAGFVRASLQPLDTCKTRLQAARHIDRPLNSIVKLVFTNAGGVRGLYRGVIPGVAGIVPAAAVYMVTFQTLKARLAERFPRRQNDVVVAIAAGLGDVAASFVRVPCEVLKQRLQVGVYANVAHALRSVGSAGGGGISRLYAGLNAQLVRDVPYAAAEFVVYENLKTLALKRADRREQRKQGTVTNSTDQASEKDTSGKRFQDRKLGRGGSLVVGAVAGAFAAIISNPADVVKTRLMTQVHRQGGVSVSAAMAHVPYRGVRDALTRVAREEGLSAFGKGITPRIAAKALQSALFFAAYEGLRRAIGTAMDIDVSDQSAH